MSKYLFIQIKGENPDHELQSYHEYLDHGKFNFSFDVSDIPEDFKIKSITVRTVSEGEVLT